MLVKRATVGVVRKHGYVEVHNRDVVLVEVHVPSGVEPVCLGGILEEVVQRVDQECHELLDHLYE